MRSSKPQFAILAFAILVVCAGGYIFSLKSSSSHLIDHSAIHNSSGSVRSSSTAVVDNDAVHLLLYASGSSSSSIPAKFVNRSAQSHSALSGYLAMVPDLYMRADENVMYATTLDTDEAHLSYFKELSDKGNVTAKMLYANRLAMPLLKRFYEELSVNGKVINAEEWLAEFSEVQKLYVDAATSGNYLAAVQLSMVPPLQVNDKEELLAWSLIADKMGSSGGQSIHRTCALLAATCTDAVLTSSAERALMYIDLYKIKAR